jgi:hypothetical protein
MLPGRQARERDKTLLVIGVAPRVEELPRFAVKRIRVAAVRRLTDRNSRNPADPKVSHAQPP